MGPSVRRQVALVTGCSAGGIGHALALELAHRGYHVVATSRSLSSMASLAASSDPGPHLSLELLALDVSSPDSVSRAVASVIAAHGRIDILVNNAGVPCVGPVAEVPLPILENTFRTNVLGPVSVIQAVVPHMIQARKGKIINIGSVAGFVSTPWSGGYCASKFALHALTDSLRVELKPFGVEVVLVAPGLVASKFGENAASIFKSVNLNIYKPFEAMLMKRIKFSRHPMATPAATFAKKTLDVVLQKNPPSCFVYGYFATMYKLMYYVPLWIKDWYFASRCGVKQLFQRDRGTIKLA